MRLLDRYLTHLLVQELTGSSILIRPGPENIQRSLLLDRGARIGATQPAEQRLPEALCWNE